MIPNSNDKDKKKMSDQQVGLWAIGVFIFLGLLFVGASSSTSVNISCELDDRGNCQVILQDQVTPPFFIKANQVRNVTTLAADTNSITNPYNIIVNPSSGIAIGDYVGLFNVVNTRYYTGTVLNVVGTNITLDTQLDSDFKTNDVVGFGITNWAVDGSITPQIFSVRGADPQLNITLDVTRVLFTCLTDTALQLNDFGDITGGLTRGLVIRRTDGVTQNYVNFKTNIEMKGWMLDWENLDDTNPGQGLHGFVARLTFTKLGIVPRIGPNEELQIMIQDDLTQIISCEMMVEGHQTN